MKVRVPSKSSIASYLKSGEIYTVSDVTNTSFKISTPYGKAFCLFKGCGHLYGGNWEIVEYDWNFKSFLSWLLKDFPAQPAGPVINY